MLTLLLVRHGNTFEAGDTPVQVGFKTDLPLTAEGREQAKRFMQYLKLKEIKPQAVYAGALLRQTESAQIVSKGIDAELILGEASLSEIDYGAWEGLTSEQICSKWPQEYAAWNTEGKWVEGVFQGSAQDHLQKIKKWLSQLLKKYAPGSTVIGFTSNGLIRFFHSLQKEKKTGDLKVKTGHFCELCLLQDKIEIVSWNQKP